MAVRFDYFNSPAFQNAWAYSDRSQQSLGLTPEEYTYLQGSGFQPFQPNAQTNIQNIDGQWKNTYVQPGQTQADFQPVTSTPTGAPTNTAYASSIQGTLPKPPAPQMSTPSTGGTNSAGSQTAPAANPWQTQPKPANALSGRAGQFGAISGAAQAPITSPPRQNAGYPGQNTGPAPAMPTGDARQRYAGGQQPIIGSDPRAAQLGAIQNFTPPAPPSTPAAGGFTEALDSGGFVQPTMPVNALSGYQGGRGDYMGYGSNGGGLRVDPNYVPENWNYQETPEYLWRQQQAERGLNRNLLARGRSNSTFGVNALSNLRSNIAGDEVDKQYQRALGANTQNYSRYLGANVTNYGRTRGEDDTAYGRAMGENVLDYGRQFQMGEQDWNRNYQLANLGLNATNTGVAAGNATGFNLSNLLAQNGATQASLALSSGSVSADQVKRLLDSGWNYQDIESLFKSGPTPSPLSLADPQGYSSMPPALPSYSGAGVGGSGMYDPQSDFWFS